MAILQLRLGRTRFSILGDRRDVTLAFGLPGRLFGGRVADPGFAAEPAATAGPPPEDLPLAEQVRHVKWYHTIELAEGVVTPGFYDHRPLLSRYGLPERLDGRRVLDVATFDGFWAFTFERRGAAEVVALDLATAAELDLPFRLRPRMSAAELARPFGTGFRIAHRALRSQVRHVHGNVYALDPAVHGTFDLVHCGDLLLHLRDPALAVARIRSVTRGEAIFSDTIYPECDLREGVPLMEYQGGRGDNIWWRFGAQALKRMIGDGGFDHVEEIARFRFGPVGSSRRIWHVVFRAR